MSRPGLIAATLYLSLAVGVLIYDARAATSGNWITLKTMAAFLVTLPVSAPLAMAGYEPDLSNRVTLVCLLLLCAALIYWVAVWIASLFR